MMHQAHQDELQPATRTILQVAGTCSAGILWAVGTPWWVRAVCIAAGFGYAVVLAVFPQRSADRLAWWQDRRRHKERCSSKSPRCDAGGRDAGMLPLGGLRDEAVIGLAGRADHQLPSDGPDLA
jgi:hypothetical protein